MYALKSLGIACAIFFCILPILGAIPSLTKPLALNDEQGKRIHKKLRIYYWDYLLIVIPILLLLIAFFSKDQAEQTLSLLILCLGYTFLILMEYGNKLHVRKINFWFLSVSIAITVASFFFGPEVKELQVGPGHNISGLFYGPIMAYCYIMAARWIIKKLTGSYPIAMVRSKDIGFIYSLDNRRANWWDLLWCAFNAVAVPLLLILANN